MRHYLWAIANCGARGRRSASVPEKSARARVAGGRCPRPSSGPGMPSVRVRRSCCARCMGRRNVVGPAVHKGRAGRQQGSRESCGTENSHSNLPFSFSPRLSTGSVHPLGYTDGEIKARRQARPMTSGRDTPQAEFLLGVARLRKRHWSIPAGVGDCGTCLASPIDGGRRRRGHGERVTIMGIDDCLTWRRHRRRRSFVPQPEFRES